MCDLRVQRVGSKAVTIAGKVVCSLEPSPRTHRGAASSQENLQVILPRLYLGLLASPRLGYAEHISYFLLPKLANLADFHVDAHYTVSAPRRAPRRARTARADGHVGRRQHIDPLTAGAR